MTPGPRPQMEGSMNGFKVSRPSPAMIVSVIAMSLALIGTAVAAPAAVERAITKSKVKKVAKKQANKVLSAREASLNVNSAKTADSATTATTATNATNAQNAQNAQNAANAQNAVNAQNATNAQNAATVNGQKVTRVFAKVPVNTTQTIATFDSFVITLTCNAAGNVEDLDVNPQTTDVDLSASGNGNTGPIFDNNQGSEPNSVSLDDDGVNDNDRGNATFAIARSGGLVASGVISFDDTDSFDAEPVCAAYGQVTQGS